MRIRTVHLVTFRADGNGNNIIGKIKYDKANDIVLVQTEEKDYLLEEIMDKVISCNSYTEIVAEDYESEEDEFVAYIDETESAEDDDDDIELDDVDLDDVDLRDIIS